MQMTVDTLQTQAMNGPVPLAPWFAPAIKRPRTRKSLRSLSLLSLFMALIGLFPSLSHAHKIRVFAWVAGDTVTVESGFSGGRPLVQGTVDVQNATTGVSLLQGKTNGQGIFTFSLAETSPKKGTGLRIIVSGGEGHRNEWLLQTEDYPQGVGQDKNETTGASPFPNQITSGPNDTETLTRILDQLLEEKLAPIRRSLAQTEDQKPKLTDILGAIGYLVGIAGIIAWMKSRK
jgi:nickel transport protein